jgi:hypothetical protein
MLTDRNAGSLSTLRSARTNADAWNTCSMQPCPSQRPSSLEVLLQSPPEYRHPISSNAHEQGGCIFQQSHACKNGCWRLEHLCHAPQSDKTMPSCSPCEPCSLEAFCVKTLGEHSFLPAVCLMTRPCRRHMLVREDLQGGTCYGQGLRADMMWCLLGMEQAPRRCGTGQPDWEPCPAERPPL